MANILLVEDNLELALLVQAFLKKEGFLCYHALSAEDAMKWLDVHTPIVIILDIMLPGIDGFAFCQYVRYQSQVPILIISAKSTKTDKLMGFELGADDYIEKPIDPDILCAKVKAITSRLNHKPKRLVSGNIEIDIEAHKVYLNQQELELNVKEYELLLLFIENSGKTLHKDYLFNQIWGMDSMSENQTLTVHIKMLRAKIESDSRQPKRIQTVWGIGYRYEEL
ncbi:MAG: response regulator transcription factor [Coprobacillus sp.]